MAFRSAKYWREAATLILAARIPPQAETSTVYTSSGTTVNRNFDYKILMLRRSSKSSFLPSAYVFPGGVASEADFSAEWNGVFQKVSGKSLVDLAKEIKISGPRPPMISDAGSHSQTMLGDLAFRICAIRETFEESGLLLAKNKSSLQRASADAPKGTRFESQKLIDWRQRVDQDPCNFVKLCEELEVVPDIWSLSEWSNWLTPVMSKVDIPPARPKRYDTLFYMCCLEEEGAPLVQTDNSETHAPEVSQPVSIL